MSREFQVAASAGCGDQSLTMCLLRALTGAGHTLILTPKGGKIGCSGGREGVYEPEPFDMASAEKPKSAVFREWLIGQPEYNSRRVTPSYRSDARTVSLPSKVYAQE